MTPLVYKTHCGSTEVKYVLGEIGGRDDCSRFAVMVPPAILGMSGKSLPRTPHSSLILSTAGGVFLGELCLMSLAHYSLCDPG